MNVDLGVMVDNANYYTLPLSFHSTTQVYPLLLLLVFSSRGICLKGIKIKVIYKINPLFL